MQLGWTQHSLGAGEVEYRRFVPDAPANNTLIVGGQGTGKSTIAKAAAISDIENDKGLAYFTAKREDVHDLLRHMPQERLQDVVIMDFAGAQEHPIGLNVCHNIPEARHAEMSKLIAGAFRATYESMFEHSWGAQLQSYVLQASRLMLAAPEGTLLGIIYLLAHDEYRADMLAHCKAPAVQKFWQIFYDEWMTDRDKRQNTLSTLNKFEPIVSDPLLANTLGQPKSSVSIDWILKERKILLVCLDELDELQTKILASLLLALFHYHAHINVQRDATGHRVVADELLHFSLYLDDAHRYMTTLLSTVLSTSSNTMLPIALVTPTLSQLSHQREQILAACTATVAFRLTDDDVRKLANKFEYTTDRDRDLATAPDFRAFYGCGTDTREVHSLLPDWSPQNGSINAAYTIARDYYGRPKERIERHINKFINHLDTNASRKQNDGPKRGIRTSARYKPRPKRRLPAGCSDKPGKPLTPAQRRAKTAEIAAIARRENRQPGANTLRKIQPRKLRSKN